jgi:hypothetical protein
LKRKNVKIVGFVNFATNLRSGGWPSFKMLFHFTSMDAFEIIAWEYWRDPTKSQSKKALKSLAMLVSLKKRFCYFSVDREIAYGSIEF